MTGTGGSAESPAREPTWFEVVVADAVARYDALPDYLKPIVVVHP